MPFLKHKRLWTRRAFQCCIAIVLGVVLLTTTLPFPLPALAAQVSADSLVGYWKFDETSGTSAADSSGDGNSGTHTNSPTISTDVPSAISFSNGRSLSFDGTDDYVACGTTLGLSGDFAGTISAWVKPTDLAQQGAVFIAGTSVELKSFAITIETNGSVAAQYNGGIGRYTGASAIVAGQWTHVVVTKTPGAIETTTKIYINGTDQSSLTGQTGTPNFAASLCYIGQWTNAGLRFKGLLDDVRIYSRALAPWEITELAAGRHIPAYWNGTSTTGFENASNWSGSYIPDPYSKIDVRFRGNQPLTLTGAISAAGLTIGSGAALKLNGQDFTMKDSGTFTNYGTLQIKGNETLTSVTNSTDKGTVLVYGTGSYTGLPTGANYGNLNLNDGLVGYWKLDETSGTRAVDSSGYGNSGSLLNSPTISSTVAPTNFTNARSVSFDGVNDYVSVLDSPDVRLTGSQYSISHWVKIDSLSNYENTLWKIHWGIITFANGSWAFQYGNNGAGNAISATGVLENGTWKHLAVVSDGATIKTYTNGIESASVAYTANTSSTNRLEIGADTNNSRYLGGSIDDVRIYNRALTPAEIATLAAGNQPSTGLATVTLNSALDVNGDLTLNGGTLDPASSNYAVTVGGSWMNNGGKFTAQKGTVTLDGTTSSLQILSGGQRFNALTINGNAGTYTLADRLTASGALALTNGILDASTGNFTVRAGTISQTSGTFTARSGLVVLTSPADQTATITSTLSTLRIEDPTENGLVGYWKFDEGTNSGAILDSSGYGNTGVRRGGAGRIWTGSTLYTPSAIQFDNPYAMTFDGVDDYVDVGDISVADFGTGNFAVSFWAKWTDIGTFAFIAKSNSSALENGFNIYQLGSSVGQITYYNQVTEVHNGSGLNDGVWHHISAVREGTGTNQVKIYIDGVVGVNTTTDSRTLSNSRNLTFGDFHDSGTYGMAGSLDDVRIYNRALSANEVANLARGRYAAGNSSTSTFTLGGNLSVATLGLDSGNLATSSSTLTVTNALNILRGGGNLTLGSALASLNGGLTLSGSTLTGGAGTLDVNGSLAMSTGSLIAPSGTMTVSGNFTMSGGTFDSNGGTITLDGSTDQGLRMPGVSSTQDFSTLRINKSAGSLILGSAISGALLQLSQSTFSPGSTVVTAQATTIDGGTLTRGAANFNSRTLTLSSGTYNANGRQSIWSGAVLLSGGTYTASTATQTFGSSLTISGGTYTGSSGTADINGNFTLNSGTFTAPSIVLLSGNFTNVAGTFTQGSGLFTLDGNAQTLSGSLTFYDLSKTVSSGTTLFFHAGNTVTVTNTLTLQGAASNTLKLRSTTAATQWKIDPQVTRTLSYVDIQDSWNMNATAIDCTSSNCTDSGNNTNWTFPSTASTGGTGNNRARQRNAEAASGGGGGGGGGSVSTGTGATPFVFVPNYAPLATRLTEAQRKAREGSLALPTETARKILEIREALLARFQMQLSDARKREEEREAAEAAFLEQDALATTEERRFARAQQLAQEKGGDRLSSPGKVAERRGLLSMVLGTQAVIYRDVSVTAWFAPYVSLLIEEDIAQGYKDDAGELTGEFGVANAVTLAEALKMAVEAAGIDVEQPLAPPRNPSAVGTWASAYVAIAEDRGISVFTPETDVHRSATRGEVIAILLQATGVPVGSSVQVTGDFSDLPFDHPHAAAITVATFYGLISGDDGKNTVRPDDFINRAEVSKIVALVRELMR